MPITAADLIVRMRADSKDAEAGIKRVDKGCCCGCATC